MCRSICNLGIHPCKVRKCSAYKSSFVEVIVLPFYYYVEAYIVVDIIIPESKVPAILGSIEERYKTILHILQLVEVYISIKIEPADELIFSTDTPTNRTNSDICILFIRNVGGC